MPPDGISITEAGDLGADTSLVDASGTPGAGGCEALGGAAAEVTSALADADGLAPRVAAAVGEALSLVVGLGVALVVVVGLGVALVVARFGLGEGRVGATTVVALTEGFVSEDGVDVADALAVALGGDVEPPPDDGAEGVTGAEGLEAAPAPAMLVARTVNVCVTPLASPVTVQVVPPPVVHV